MANIKDTKWNRAQNLDLALSIHPVADTALAPFVSTDHSDLYGSSCSMHHIY